MRLLILGGTHFFGRHLVEVALSRGHEVTLFNRGTTNPELFPEVERLRGDRDGGLDVLRDRRWDAVVDSYGFRPRVVGDSVRLLQDAVEHYTFISTLGVYQPSPDSKDEDSPLMELGGEDPEEVTIRNYGALKALCEQVVREGFGERALVVRSGLMMGPYDYTDRYTYWVGRVAEGGEVLAPGPPETHVEGADARDLASWVVRMVEERRQGTYNVNGPAEPLHFGTFLETCRAISGSDARFTWVDEEFLHHNKVRVWEEIPVWLPRGAEGLCKVSNARARDAGLVFRPLADTLRDILEWDRARPAEERRRVAGMSPGRERELLEAWHRR
ncbi:MAG TPA: NAD-dependent epimerase/dehydratase family protein [Longimicrobiaceae bacterium]|nr:NAD-dependent epimerase/dehydratase family protein [Longimicrobiaceae bacterium]